MANGKILVRPSTAGVGLVDLLNGANREWLTILSSVKHDGILLAKPDSGDPFLRQQRMAHPAWTGIFVAFTGDNRSINDAARASDGRWIVYERPSGDYGFPSPKDSDLERFGVSRRTKNVLLAIEHSLDEAGNPSLSWVRNDRGYSFFIPDMAKVFAMEMPLDLGWHLTDKFGLGLPVGEKSDESNPNARHLYKGEYAYVGAIIRGLDGLIHSDKTIAIGWDPETKLGALFTEASCRS